MRKFLKYLFQLILSPVNGWEDIATAHMHPGVVAARGFYPLTAVAAISVFAGKIFHPLLTLQQLLVEAIITFMMFFLGYFSAVFLLEAGFESIVGSEPAPRRINLLALFSISMLALVQIIGKIVPITLAITWFMPIYVAIVIWKGSAFMGVEPYSSGRYMLLAVPSIIFPTYLIDLLLTLLLK